MVRAIWNGEIIAESDRTVVVEGKHYFPAEDVDHDKLEPSSNHSVCPWKGEASYYHVNVDGRVNRDAAWTYPKTTAAAKGIE